MCVQKFLGDVRVVDGDGGEAAPVRCRSVQVIRPDSAVVRLQKPYPDPGHGMMRITDRSSSLWADENAFQFWQPCHQSFELLCGRQRSFETYFFHVFAHTLDLVQRAVNLRSLKVKAIR